MPLLRTTPLVFEGAPVSDLLETPRRRLGRPKPKAVLRFLENKVEGMGGPEAAKEMQLLTRPRPIRGYSNLRGAD